MTEAEILAKALEAQGRGDVTAALGFYETLGDRIPSAALWLKACLFAELDRVSDARTLFSAALAHHPDHGEAVAKWAGLELRSGDLEKAKALIGQAQALLPQSPDPWLLAMELADRNKDPDAARFAAMEALSRLVPDVMGELEEALWAFDAGSDLDSTIQEPLVQATSASRQARVALLRAAGLYDGGDPARCDAIFRQLLLPMITQAGRAQDFDSAVELGELAELTVMQQPLTAERHHEIASALTQTLAPHLPPLPVQRIQPSDGPIMLVVPVAAGTSADKLAARALAALGLPRIIIAASKWTEKGRACYGAPTFEQAVWQAPPDGRSRFDALAILTAETKPSTVLYLADTLTVQIASRKRLAPRQIYWTMAFRVSVFDDVDVSLSSIPGPGGQLNGMIEGRNWRFLWPSYAPAPASADQPRPPRGKLRFGTLGRAVKIDNDGFVATLAEILKRFPDAVYAYTGKQDPESLRLRLARFGIDRRCRHLGFVDPFYFAASIDIHLDSFPFATGEAAAQVMQCGTPSVSLAGSCSLMDVAVVPVFSGAIKSEELGAQLLDQWAQFEGVLYPKDQDVYLDAVMRLANDPDMRVRTGQFVRALSRQLLTRTDLMAQSLRDALTSF